jgi:hypothetical protein
MRVLLGTVSRRLAPMRATPPGTKEDHTEDRAQMFAGEEIGHSRGLHGPKGAVIEIID